LATDNYFGNTRVDYHFRAHITGLMRTVKRRLVGAHPKIRTLDYCILFGMQTSYTVPTHQMAANIQTMRQTHRRTVVAGREDAAIADNHRANLAT